MEDRQWLQLGNRQFFIEDVSCIFIQANHLIINFDYTDKQIVIHFGRGEEGHKEAKKIFDELGEFFKAYKFNLPETADLSPDLLKTAYGEEISREIQDRVHFHRDKMKLRYERKLEKMKKELDILNDKIKEDYINDKLIKDRKK